MEQVVLQVLGSALVFLGGVVLTVLFGRGEHRDPVAATAAYIARLREKVSKKEEKGKASAAPLQKDIVQGRRATVIAEAAFDAGRKKGAGAVWARCGRRKVERSTAFDAYIHTRDHASVEALSRAIHFVVDEFELRRGDAVMVLSASEHAVDALTGRKTLHENRTAEAAAVAGVNALVSKVGISLTLKHIHDPGGNLGRRTRASLLCEKEAQERLDAHIAECGGAEDRLIRADARA